MTWQAEVAEVVEEEVEREYYYPPTLRFPTPDMAVVSDGRGRVSVLRTNDRSAAHSCLVNFETESPWYAYWRVCER